MLWIIRNGCGLLARRPRHPGAGVRGPTASAAISPAAAISAASWPASGTGAARRLSMTVCGAASRPSRRMLATNVSKSSSLAVSRGEPRAMSRSRRVAASERTQTRRTVPPPSACVHDSQRSASWICCVKGPDSSTGQPWPRISRAVAVMPAYSCTLMCSSYHWPSRSPGGRPAAASAAATNGPYIVSLSSSAGAGSRSSSSRRATVLLPAPGGPATTHAGAGTVMLSTIRGRAAGACPTRFS